MIICNTLSFFIQLVYSFRIQMLMLCTCLRYLGQCYPLLGLSWYWILLLCSVYSDSIQSPLNAICWPRKNYVIQKIDSFVQRTNVGLPEVLCALSWFKFISLLHVISYLSPVLRYYKNIWLLRIFIVLLRTLNFDLDVKL